MFDIFKYLLEKPGKFSQGFLLTLKWVYTVVLADRLYVTLVGAYNLNEPVTFQSMMASVLGGKLLTAIFILFLSFFLVNIIIASIIGSFSNFITNPKPLDKETKKAFLWVFHFFGLIQIDANRNITAIDKRKELFELAEAFRKKEAISEIQKLTDAYLNNIIIPYFLFVLFYFLFFAAKPNSSVLSLVIIGVGILLLIGYNRLKKLLQAFFQTAPVITRLITRNERLKK